MFQPDLALLERCLGCLEFQQLREVFALVVFDLPWVSCRHHVSGHMCRNGLAAMSYKLDSHEVKLMSESVRSDRWLWNCSSIFSASETWGPVRLKMLPRLCSF